jgi:hypothetical protein
VVIGQEGKSVGSLISARTTTVVNLARRGKQAERHLAELNTKVWLGRGRRTRSRLTTSLKLMVVGMALSAFWAALVGTPPAYPDPVAALHAGRRRLHDSADT